MSFVPVTVAFGVALAIAANPSVWTAKLNGQDGSKINGSARVETVAAVTPPRDSATPPASTPTPASDELRVTVTVNNAAPNSTLSWSLRSGECDDKGTEVKVIGAASGSVKVDAQGSGTATTSVKATLPSGTDDFHIALNSHEGSGKLAACGDLEAAKTSTEN
jgi:hypothetical protein